MPAAIEVEGVSKRFRLYHEKYTSLKERAIHFGRIPFEEFWALSGIELDINEGETFGLLGHNGSGKSTLLKCVAGILQPTSGQIRTVGRLAALLELGAGFHPDLTGRENVFLNASILGMAKKEITARFDDIVAFAELEQFIDNQVKYYSSGMYVRLGFAVAVNMEPDILLVDEVLSVGDELFQRKCLDRVKQFQREGRTIVFVTHAADLVRQICDRAAVLDQGKQVALGTPAEAVRSFREHLLQRQRYDEADQIAAAAGVPGSEGGAGEVAGVAPMLTQEGKRNHKVRVTSVRFEHDGTGPALVPGEPLTVRIGYEASETVDDVVFGIAVYDIEGRTLFGTNTDLLGVGVPALSGTGEVRFAFEGVPLTDGTYPVTVGVHSHDEATVYDWREQGYSFEVMNPGRGAGLLFVPAKVSFS
jgi:ABC-2 type transport system ATP-binding protein